MKCLLIASIFAPIHGGSAVVYESLCRYSPSGVMQVLAPWRHYATTDIIDGWQEHDAQALYPVHRIELLRAPAVTSTSLLQSLWLLLAVDLPLQLRVLLKTIQIVRREQINVICIGELNSGSWLGLFCQRWLGCKMINYIHGEEITTVTPYRFYGRRRHTYLKRADAVIAVSEFTRQALIEQMQVDPAKIELITNGVDLDRFQPGPKDPALIERYGVQGKRLLLTVGRLVPRKGIDLTLRALPAILARHPDVHYLIVGTGPYQEELQQIVAELGLAASVTFAGRVLDGELAAHYRLCDLFVMANRELSDHDTEGFGLVFLEANACGKAVVGGRAGGAVEAVRDGQNGLLVDGHDPGAIASTINRLLSDDALRQRLESEGLAIARASGSERGAAQFVQLCKRLVGEVDDAVIA